MAPACMQAALGEEDLAAQLTAAGVEFVVSSRPRATRALKHSIHAAWDWCRRFLRAAAAQPWRHEHRVRALEPPAHMLPASCCHAPQTVACSDDSISASGAMAQAKEGKAQVVVVCSSVAEADDSTDAGLAAEVAQVAAIQQAVNEAGLDHVFMYASVPKALPEPGSDGKRRSLLQATFSGFGMYTTCGPLCQVGAATLQRHASCCSPCRTCDRGWLSC